MSTPEPLDQALLEERELLLALLLEDEGQSLVQPDSITPRSAGGPSPLSRAQERLWVLEQFAPGNPVYNEFAAVRLVGDLDPDALARALGAVAARHDVLRTRIALVDGQPVQAIDPSAAPRLALVDLAERPVAEQEGELERLIAAEARQPFDLAAGPLARFTLVRLAEREHIVLMAAHHSVCDGWSIGVLTGELAALYPALAAGQPAPLAPLPLQYADYAAWQRQWLAGPELDRQLGYWRRQLGGELPVLELPADRPRRPVQSYRGARHRFALSPELTGALEQLGQREGTTLFMTLLAAFDALLARHTGLTDILVGTPIAGRTRREMEGLIGCFVNTLVLRTDLSGEPSFRELLGRVRAVALDAYANQDLPFDLVVEALQPERALSHNPLFQILFVLQNTPPATLELPGLALQPLPVSVGTAKFDLELSLERTTGGLDGVFEYCTDLFDHASIERLAEHFRRLLEAAVAAPDQPVTTLPLLTSDEQRQVAAGWSPNAVAYPPARCRHELVGTRQAGRHGGVAAAGRVYLLDRAGRPVPAGVPGELYLSGDGAGLEAPAGPSVRNPFGTGVLRRTGELARWRPDGTIEYVGRLDHQVRLRGFGFDLAEVESALGQHADLDQAVVVAWPEPAGGQSQVVAYVVPRPGATPSPEELRAHLRQRLPEYMVPPTCLILDALPLSEDGRPDHRALPVPSVVAPAAAAFAPPRTRTEERLAAMCAELLTVERVGVHDDFFELGGTSLTATRLLIRVRDVLRVEVSLRELFEAPTIGEFAAVVDAAPPIPTDDVIGHFQEERL